MAKNHRSLMAPTLKLYADLGWDIDACERFVKTGRTGFNKDMFGFGDAFAFKGTGLQRRTAIIQITDKPHKAAHMKTIKASEIAARWVSSPSHEIHLVVWGDGDPPTKYKLTKFDLLGISAAVL